MTRFLNRINTNVCPRHELLLQQYIQQYIANTPDKRNKRKDIYQCGYYINETYNWGFTGDAAGTGGYLHYYSSSYTYEYRCIWLYNTCGSTITFYNGGITTGSSSSSSSTSTTTQYPFIDDDGILHVDIPPIDMETSTESQILEQFLKVLREVRIYFCEGNYYEPIDWRDYFYNVKNVGSMSSYWKGCNITYNYNIYLEPHFIMTTDPGSAENTTNFQGIPSHYYVYYLHNTNFPNLTITIPEPCTDSFEDYVFPPCN